jgi:hypothetical protein
MTKQERIDKLMVTLDLFDSTFPNHTYKSGLLFGILLDLVAESNELFEVIDHKLRGIILWKAMSNPGVEEDREK